MSWDNIWEDVFSRQPWGKYPGESLIRFVARNYYNSNRQSVKILEVGFGTGANIWYLAKEKFSVYGIEASLSGIRIARERLREEGLSAELIQGDIINLPYEDNFFDAVIDNECIYCNDLVDTNKIFAEIKRVLKRNGKFYSRTFSANQFIGTDYIVLGENEYSSIKEGPLSGKGFARLTPRESIGGLYGKYFDIISVDTLESTWDNGSVIISEFIIVSKKINDYGV